MYTKENSDVSESSLGCRRITQGRRTLGRQAIICGVGRPLELLAEAKSDENQGTLRVRHPTRPGPVARRIFSTTLDLLMLMCINLAVGGAYFKLFS